MSLPLAVIVLIALFAAQSRGTAKVAALFGPVMVVWFVSIAIAGAHAHSRRSARAAMRSIRYYGVAFLLDHGTIGLDDAGRGVPVVTGGEALYADLGHFGRKPIQTAWLVLVLPALLINYFGQGAKVLADPGAIENPFFRLVPDALLLPMVVLATAATVIASQAVITGAYSLVHQAIQLGLLPRLAILHTSASHVGQIYIPRVTMALLIGVLLLVGYVPHLERAGLRLRHRGRDHDGGGRHVGLRRDLEAMAMAAVAGGGCDVAVRHRRCDVLLRQFPEAVRGRLGAAVVRRRHGAADPDLAARHRILSDKTRRTEVPIDTLFRSLTKKPPHIVPGTAVFLTSDPDFAPTALLHNLKHNKVLHENNVILTIITADTPRVPEDERVQITPMSAHFTRCR